MADAMADLTVLLMLAERACVPLDARDDRIVVAGTEAGLVGDKVCRTIRRAPSTMASLINGILFSSYCALQLKRIMHSGQRGPDIGVEPPLADEVNDSSGPSVKTNPDDWLKTTDSRAFQM
jgi:hypothetical protein